MKQKDWSTIVIVAIVSAMISLVLSRILFSTPEDRAQKVEVVEPISTIFETPDDRYFNANAVNPSAEVSSDLNTPNSDRSGTQ